MCENMCFCVLPLWSCAPFGLSVLPAWLPCQNVLPADLHAIPFARNTQQVLVFAAPVANACCPLLYSCRSITFAAVAQPVSLSFDGSSVAGATLALTVRFPIFVAHHHGPHGLVLRLSCIVCATAANCAQQLRLPSIVLPFCRITWCPFGCCCSPPICSF